MRHDPLAARLLKFGVVGGSAFAVHWLMVMLLVAGLGLPPLWANLIGFACAFPVSYLGHKYWTFSAADLAHSQSLLRFSLTALLGLALNETLYALMLWMAPEYYALELVGALIVSAVGVYLLSHYWAFPATASPT